MFRMSGLSWTVVSVIGWTAKIGGKIELLLKPPSLEDSAFVDKVEHVGDAIRFHAPRGGGLPRQVCPEHGKQFH